MDFITCALTTSQLYKYILEARAKSRDTGNFKIMRVNTMHFFIVLFV